MSREREQTGFRDVRDERTGKKLFRYDDSRDIIEIKERGKPPVLVDMRRVRAEGRKQD